MSAKKFNRSQCECKTFRDNVHGYISIPKEYVRRFIDTELFQRLRQIEQTGMRALYPGARHDRFAHSLGVLHLAGRAFERFWRNSKKDAPKLAAKVGGDSDWKTCGVLFEIAALLHDCGHAPFSHTLEFLYDYGKDKFGSPAMNGSFLNERLLELNSSEDFKQDFMTLDESGKSSQGAPHERMSALLVRSEYGDAIGELLEMMDDTPEAADDKKKQELDEALEFITRMIIGCRYRANLTEKKSLQNCFITLLNSSSIDVDKLDYIMRDADMSGLNTMTIDTDRLLDSLTLVPVAKLTDVPLDKYAMDNVILRGTLRSFDDGRKASLTECEINGTLEVNFISSVFDRYHFEVKGTLNLNGVAYPVQEDETEKPLPEEKIQWNGKIPKDREKGRAEYKEANGRYFTLDNASSARFKTLEAAQIDFSDTYAKGAVSGLFTGEVVGNDKAVWPSASEKTYCEVGYRKSSLNVIESVTYARNYEYQWVHAHHKVKYYGDYLLYALLRGSVKYLLTKAQPGAAVTDDDVTREICNALSCGTMKGFHPYAAPWGDKYWRPADSDILALFAKCHILLKEERKSGAMKEESEDLLHLLDEYAGRSYRKSLWKSYAEMRNYLSGLTRDQIGAIWNFFCKNARKDWPFIHENISGCLNSEWAKKFAACHMRDVVWVNGQANLKKLDQNKTYIYFPGDSPENDRVMTFASVSRSIGSEPQSVEYDHLLYLYYNPTLDGNGDEEKVDKAALIKLFEEIANA